MLGRRLLTIILTTIVPTVLLNVISYATNHFKVSITILSDNILFPISFVHCLSFFLHKSKNELSYRSTTPRPSSLKPSLQSIWPRCSFKPHCSLRYCKILILYIKINKIFYYIMSYQKCSSHHLNWTLYLPLLSVCWGMSDNLNFKPNNLVPPHYNFIKNMIFCNFFLQVSKMIEYYLIFFF